MRFRVLDILHDRKGAVALFLGLMAAPVFGFAGLAVDFMVIQNARGAAQHAADTAVLTALASSTPSNSRVDAARMAFMATMPGDYKAGPIHLDIEIRETDSSREAKVTYEIDIPLFFAGLFGEAATTFSGFSSSRSDLDAHYDVRFWLDDSASMGVAATETDRDRLQAISRDDPDHANCAFACHLPTRMKPGRWSNTLDRARDMGVRIRLDVMMENVKALIETLQEDRQPGQRIRFQVAAMSREFRGVAALTQDSDIIARRLSRFKPSGANHSESASRLSETLAAGVAAVPRWRGLGTLQRPKQFVVIVTDGMQFDWNSISPGPINPAVCSGLKDRGVTVAVVQLRYVTLPHSAFNHWVRPVLHQLEPALRACASPGMHFSGDTPDQIKAAFHELAQSLNRTLRLTR